MPKTDQLIRYFPPLFTILAGLLIWWLITTLELVNPLFLPRPSAVGKSFINLLSETSIYIDVFVTLSRAIVGLMLSAIVGIPLGLIFGRYPQIYDFFELPVDFFRSIPSSALFFLFILLFGIGNASKVAVVFYGCSLILLVAAYYGAKPSREKQDRINMLKSFGANSWQILYLSVFRDAVPNILTGFRVCVSLSLVLVIVTEMFLGANDGLGRRIYDFYLAYRLPEMYTVLIILGLVGFVSNRISLLVERRVAFWLPAE